MLPVAISLEQGGVIWRLIVLVVFIVGSKIYQIYEFQVKEHILPYDGITNEIYHAVFLKKDLRYGWFYDLKFDSLPSGKERKLSNKYWMRSSDFVFNGPEKMLYLARPLDNPLLSVHSEEERDPDQMAAATVSLHIKILSAGTTPSFKAFYYKGGVPIKQNEFYFGSKIPRVNEWCRVNLELYPELKWKDFDSLVCRVEEGNTFVQFKEISISTYSFYK
jgi:hypothetical protein